MKKFVSFKLNGLAILAFISVISGAKEIKLTLEARTQYPISLHYTFLSNNIKYGGYFTSMLDKEIQYVYVNKVPDNDNVLITIDKMSTANRTVFGDPCEIKLNSTELNARVTIGFKGDPVTHGSFNCFVQKN